MTRGKMMVTDDELLNVFRRSEDPALFTEEVAEQVGMSRQGVGRRLRDLVRTGTLQRKQGGHRSVVYWLPDADDTESEADDSA